MERTDKSAGSKPEESQTWENVKEALRRDWDQTKYDFGSKFGQDLGQGVSNTVAQASGNEAIPDRHTANIEHGWTDEAAVRYGYSAAQSPDYRGQHEWNGAVEQQLKKGWEGMNADRPWAEVRVAVRYGWTRSPDNAAAARTTVPQFNNPPQFNTPPQVNSPPRVDAPPPVTTSPQTPFTPTRPR